MPIAPIEGRGVPGENRRTQNIIDDPAPYKKIIQIPDLTARPTAFEELLQEKKITSRAAVQQDHNA